MRCGQHGCGCTTCLECGKDYTYCICDLKARTQAYIADQTIQDGCNEAHGLLLEWLESV